MLGSRGEEGGRKKTYIALASLLVLPDGANLLRVHVVHGKDGFAPVGVAKGHAGGLLAVEHGVGLLDAHALVLLEGHGHHEVAAAVLWLASDSSGFTVGHDLVLDGGATA